jgi:hypothetical protein
MSSEKMENFDPAKKKENSLTKEQAINIDEVFKDNLEIADIFNGNKELYQEYINSIFPDSKVKDIVWHGTRGDWYKSEKFNPDFTGEGSGNKSNTEGFYFIKYKRAASSFGDKKTIFPVLLDIKNPNILPLTEFNKTWFDKEKYSNLKTGDSIIGEQEKTPEEYYNDAWAKYHADIEKDGSKVKVGDKFIDYDFSIKPENPDYFHEEQLSTTYVVFKPEQIHIIGSKQDLEQAKEWLKNKQQ